MGIQSDAPFKFLVRPIITTNMSSKKLSWGLEEEIFSLLWCGFVISSISGILITPVIMDKSIARPPKDYVGYNAADNSMTVGIGLDFDLWERSSEMERLDFLVGNIRSSLDKIQNRYLLEEDRKNLHLILDEAQAQMALRLKSIL